MDTWFAAVNSWIAVLLQLAAAIAVVGISYNAVQMMVDSSLGNSQSFAALLARILGVIAALVVVMTAPALVNQLSSLLMTTLVP